MLHRERGGLSLLEWKIEPGIFRIDEAALGRPMAAERLIVEAPKARV